MLLREELFLTRTQRGLYVCCLIPSLGTMCAFPRTCCKARRDPSCTIPRPSHYQPPKTCVCHHKPMVELLPIPCPQHPVSTGVWCCAGPGFTDSFRLDLPFPAFPTSQPFCGSFALHKVFFSGAMPDTSLVLGALPAAASMD